MSSLVGTRLGLCLLPLAACLGRASLPPPQLPLARLERASFPSAPPFEPGPLPSLPSVQSTRLDNGLTVLVVQHPGEEDVVVRYVMANGAEDGRLHEVGIPSFALRVALADPSASGELDDDLALHGSSTREGAAVGLVAPRDALARAIARLGELATHPPSSNAHVRAAVFERIEQLEYERFDAASLAHDHAAHLLFGPEHPLGRPMRGTQEGIGQLSLGELERAQREQLAPDSSALVVAGDVTLEEVTTLAQRHLGSLRPEGAALVPPWSAHPTRHARGVLAPGVSAHVVVSFTAPPAGHPDALGFAALGALAGELQGSRIQRVLRVREAYTYGVRARYLPLRDAGLFSLELSVAPGQLYKVLTSLEEALAELSRIPADATELARVKVQLRERRRAALAAPSTSAELVADAFLARGIRDASALTELWGRYFSELDALRSADLQRLAAQYLPMSSGALAVSGHLWEFELALSHWDRNSERLVPAGVAERLARDGVISIEGVSE